MAKVREGNVTWKKRILLPLWAVRIILLGFLIAIFVYAIRELHRLNARTSWLAIAALHLLFIAIVLLLDLYAIILFIASKLKARVFLTINTVQTLLWTGVIAVQALFYWNGYVTHWYGVVFCAICLLTFIALEAYACVNFRRSKQMRYEPAREFLTQKFGENSRGFGASIDGHLGPAVCVSEHEHEHEQTTIMYDTESVVSAYDPSNAYDPSVAKVRYGSPSTAPEMNDSYQRSRGDSIGLNMETEYRGAYEPVRTKEMV